MATGRADNSNAAGVQEAAERDLFDTEHFARQTMGDRALAREVLGLFTTQLDDFDSKIHAADEAERRALAHTLKGAASGVGAFAIARCVGRLERQPGSGQALEQLADAITRTRAFLAAWRG